MSNVTTPNYDIDYSSIDPTTMPPPPPPSSVHGEVDEDDHHLPVDDSFHHRDGIYDTMDDDTIHQDDSELNNLNDSLVATHQLGDRTRIQHEQLQPSFPTPQQPQLTLKEKLVLRERQQRIETERARLKRQFALSLTNEEGDHMNEGDSMVNQNHIDINHLTTMESLHGNTGGVANNGQEFEEESTRAHPDEEEAAADEANRRLGFNMERFLRNSDSFNPELDSALAANRTVQSGETTNDATKRVVMERFLNDMVENANHTNVPFPPNTDVNELDCHIPSAQISEPHRSVSFDVDAATVAQGVPLHQTLDFHQETLLASMHPSFESGAGLSLVSNTSMRTEVNTVRDEFFAVDDPPLYSTSSLDNLHEADRTSLDDASSQASDDEPRVLRLTEADMLEMAAIEEASIGNAPPSDRDEVDSYSEIGELTDFGGSGAGVHRFLVDPTFTGPDTPTTALESASQMSLRSTNRGGASAVSSSATIDRADDDVVTGHADLIVGLPIASVDASHYFVASASASVAANPPSEGGRDDDDEIMGIGSQLNDGDTVTGANSADHEEMTYNGEGPTNILRQPIVCSNDMISDTIGAAESSGVDVTLMANRQRRFNPNDGSIDADTVEHHDVVDDFDFDKDEPLSPPDNHPGRIDLANDDSFRNLPNDVWSPSGQLHISPLQVGETRGLPLVVISESMSIPMQDDIYSAPTDSRPNLIRKNHNCKQSEMAPLLVRNVPALKSISQAGTDTSGSVGEPTFSNTTCDVASNKEINFLFRGLPERQIALLFTMILEVPILLLIAGGSDALCGVVGRSRYQLLLGFLPITCAISGSAALQSRAATTHAISNRNLTSTASYQTWVLKEVAVSSVLGIGMGTSMGIVAFCGSGWDFVFGITIFVAQLFSITTAAMTGTLVPILCKLIVNREAGKWSEVFVTAFQDVLGTFAIMFFSYFIVVFGSAKDVEPSDRCIIT